MVNSFTDFMYATNACVYGKEVCVKNSSNAKWVKNKWFNAECLEAKMNLNKLGIRF